MTRIDTLRDLPTTNMPVPDRKAGLASARALAEHREAA